MLVFVCPGHKFAQFGGGLDLLEGQKTQVDFSGITVDGYLFAFLDLEVAHCQDILFQVDGD